MARTLPTAPVTPISASPFKVAAVATGDDGIKTSRKSKSCFLNSPASCAIQGMDWDITCAEWRPVSRSAPIARFGGNSSNPRMKNAGASTSSQLRRWMRIVFLLCSFWSQRMPSDLSCCVILSVRSFLDTLPNGDKGNSPTISRRSGSLCLAISWSSKNAASSCKVNDPPRRKTT